MANFVSTLSADPVNAERWRPVPGYPRYRVSTRGRVQTKRSRDGRPTDDWRDLAVILDGHGYPQVWLTRFRRGQDGRRARWFGVHQVVMLAFRGPPPSGQIVRHVLNNDPCDNRLENLAYGTHGQNAKDKNRHGTMRRGERHHKAKLDEQAVRRIRALMERCPRESRWKATEVLARQHGVAVMTVWNVVRRKSWSHI